MDRITFRLIAAFLLLGTAAAPPMAGDSAEEVPDLSSAVAAALKAIRAGQPSNGDVRISAVPNPNPQASSSSSAPAIAVTSVGVGNTTAEVVPCLDCVPGGDPSVATAIPLAVLSAGSAVEYTLQWQSTSYSGPCTPAYAIVQLPNTVLDSDTHSFPNCQSNFVYVVAWHGKILPYTTGPAILVGVIRAGINKSVWYQPITIQ